jgi:DNA helicase-2/ATP-dependent DNA helicase PcrA
MPANEISANDIFLAIQPPEKLLENPGMRLTEEQQLAVEAKPDSAVMVIAGAGSGKTELMAIRVLWLVANGYARPEEILGLTFTRKAASELSRRIVNGLSDLNRTEFWPESLKDGFANPVISTYNAYANTLFRDYALQLGYEPESNLLTEGGQYQLAKRVVLDYASTLGTDLDDAEVTLKTAIEGVISLAASLNDNLATGEQIKAVAAKVREQIMRVTGGAPLPATHQTFFAGLFKTEVIADLAEIYRRKKLEQGLVDYSDQVALAERAVQLIPEAKTREREVHRFVLLDEYQDTSFLQTRLLEALYADHPVFAVGDPIQSIYGWRGASSTNLNEFVAKFSTSESNPVIQLTLSTSWRNPKVVLDAANVTAAPLATLPAFAEGRGIAKTKVVQLESRPGAGEGLIHVDWQEDIVQESLAVASWLKAKMTEGGKDVSAAVLFRLRHSMSLFVAELQSQGLDVDVVGLSGLLEMPEIIDLVSALKVVHSPNAGSQLIRLLAGPRWRIGPKDIQRLHRWSRKLSKQANESLAAEVDEPLGAEYEASLVDALDLLVDFEKATLYGMSEESLRRLRDAGQFLRDLRSQTGLPLIDFVKFVSRELQLDIELAANTRLVNPMAHLNAFFGMVANYSANSSAYLGAFIEWLDFAESREKLDVPTVSQKKGVVQVLTVHSAKGLECDFVAVPNMVTGEFPQKPKSTKAWFRLGVLPYELRGDKDSLPIVDLTWAAKPADFGKVKEQLSSEMKTHLEREERRLAYVAFTRPKKELHLSGSVWKNSGGARELSPYVLELLELADKRIVVSGSATGQLPVFDTDTNPLEEHAITQTWPADPLGEAHRIKVVAAAEAAKKHSSKDSARELKSLGEQGETDAHKFAKRINSEIGSLVLEAQLAESRSNRVKLPVRIPASQFKDFVKSPKDVAEKFRRPLPERPFEATMTGTLFHSWVEQRFGIVATTEVIDGIAEVLEQIEDASSEKLETLQANFEKSRFASMKAREIETEIQVTIDQNTFICKIDAVFDVPENDPELPGKRIEIVDWKTGAPPDTPEEEAERALQLALYRMAYAIRHNIDEESIAVCLYYVNADKIVRPKVLNSSEVIETWKKVLASFESEEPAS